MSSHMKKAAKPDAKSKTAPKAEKAMPARLAEKFAERKKSTGMPKVSASRAVARKPSSKGR
jgi:hypothetical protein